MRRTFLCCIMLTYFIVGCHSQQSLKEKQDQLTTGKIDDTFKYSCKEVGWETSLPKDWNLLTKEETEKMNAKGKKAMEESTGNTIDVSGLTELVNLKKDLFNSFLSTIEKYDISTGSYDDHNTEIDKLINDTYNAKNIKFDTKTGNEKIDNVVFHTLEITLYKPGSKEVLLNQKMYNTLLNGYDFAMTINYNNEGDRQTLMKIVNGSRFL